MNKEKNLLTYIISQYLPYWPLIVIMLLLSLVGAKTYLHYTTPVYEITASLIIKDEKKGVDDSEIMESINVFNSKKIVENEIEIIHSRGLMKQVVNNLSLYAPISEDKGLVSSSAYESSPIHIQLKDPEHIREGSKKEERIYFTFDRAKKEVKIGNTHYPVEKWVDSPYGLIRFDLNNNNKGEAVNPLFFELVNPKVVTDHLLQSLDISAPNKLSTVVDLRLKDPVPQRGEDVLNRLIHYYNQAAINDRNNLAANTLDFIEERMKQVEADLGKVEQEVQQYKSTKGVVDLSEQGKQYLDQVSENDRKISDVSLQLAVLSKIEKYVRSKDKSTGIVPSTLGVKDEVLSQLLNKLYDSEIEYEKLKRTTAENNPILVSISNEIEKIRPSILENVNSQRSNLQASLENLQATNGQYNSALQTIPQKERELLEISRREANKNELFSYLLKKREETALSYSPNSGDSKIVDMAESSIYPVSPNATVIYALSIVVALALSTGLITAKEAFSIKIQSKAEIEEYTKIPIIGELSSFKMKKLAKQDKEEEHLVLDQIRDLRVAMGLYGKNKNKKKILITSSVEGEGKSFVSENLAKSLAISGKKVVLINFDLRKQQASSIYGGALHKGIAEYLNGEVRLDEIINVTDFNNLYIISGGAALSDTSDVLIDLELTDFFDYLDEHFEYIIIDTPPVGVALDTYLLSNYCDTIVYIVRHNYTNKKLIERLEQNQDLDESKEIGIVYNGVRKREVEKGGYGLGNGYGYINKDRELRLKHS